MMQPIVFASALFEANRNRHVDQRELELMYAGPRHALSDIARLAAALGGLFLYAGLLAYVAR